MTLAVGFLLIVGLLLVRFAVLPNINRYRPQIEVAASRLLQANVSIADIGGEWRGWHPELALRDVAVLDNAGQAGLRIRQIRALLSWRSLLRTGDVHTLSLDIDQPDVLIERSAEGRLTVAGLSLPATTTGQQSEGARWMLAQRRIAIHNATVRWRDLAQPSAAQQMLQLNDVNFLQLNNWHHTRFALQQGTSIDLRGDLRHSLLGAIDDIDHWRGTIYGGLRQFDAAQWQALNGVWPGLSQLNGTQGDGAAWVEVNQGKVISATAQLNLDRLSLPAGLMSLSDGSAPVFNHVRGGISITGPHGLTSVRSPSSELLVQSGASLAWSGLSFSTQDGLIAPTASGSFSFRPAAAERRARWQLTSEQLALAPTAALISRLPLPRQYAALLDQLQPTGGIAKLQLSWGGDLPGPANYQFSGTLQEVGFRAGDTTAFGGEHHWPGMQGLSGTVAADQHGGHVRLATSALTVTAPGFLTRAEWPLTKVDAAAHWRVQNEALDLEVDHAVFTQQSSTISIAGSQKVLLRGVGPTMANWRGALTSFDLGHIGDYLPANAGESLRHWLTTGIHQGDVSDVTLALRGDLSHFGALLAASSGSGDNNENGLYIAGKLQRGELDISPGEFAADAVAPEWPFFKDIDGRFTIAGRRLDIHADHATNSDVALSDVLATVDEMGVHEATLHVTGKARGDAQQFVEFVRTSPVNSFIDHLLTKARGAGATTLALDLRLPLEHPHEAQARGTVGVEDVALTIDPQWPALSGMRGAIEFENGGFQIADMTGAMAGGPVQIHGSQKDGAVGDLFFSGRFSAEGLRQIYDKAGFHAWLSRVEGGSDYTGHIALTNHRADLTIESPLSGTALRFPAPFAKTGDSILPLTLRWIGKQSDDALLARNGLDIKLGNLLDGHYDLERRVDVANSDWSLRNGAVGIQRPSPAATDRGLNVAIKSEAVDLDQWLAFYDEMGHEGTIAASVGAVTPVPTPIPLTAPISSVNTPHFPEPSRLEAQVDALTLGGRAWQKIDLHAQRTDRDWRGTISSPQVKGNIDWTRANDSRDGGNVRARLERLVIVASTAVDDDAAATSETKVAHRPVLSRLPTLDIVADAFTLHDHPLGKLTLGANHSLDAGRSVWHINQLALTNPDGDFAARGEWVSDADAHAPSVTNLTYRLDMTDSGKLLERFGLPHVIRGTKGKLDGAIEWGGPPYSLDIPTLSGTLQFETESGQFLQVEPGAGRLLGVLNLQSLPRRLRLDFSDVFSKGFSYDSAAGSVEVKNGVATTNDLRIAGAGATVLMDGSADLAKETQNLHVVVLPEVNAGTASLVALAINPVLGISSALAQWLLRQPLKDALRFDYDVTGPWSDPAVVRREKNSASSNEALTNTHSTSSTHKTPSTSASAL